MRISVKHWLRILEIKGMPVELKLNWISCDYSYYNNHRVDYLETDKYFVCRDRSFIDKQAMRIIFPLCD